MTKYLYLLFAFALLVLPWEASSHRSGCHRWHSCPSDRGTYVCGDTGHCSQCPDNQYCLNRNPRRVSEQDRSSKTQSTQDLSPLTYNGIIDLIRPMTTAQAKAYLQSLKGKTLRGETDINDPVFAHKAARTLLAMLSIKSKS